MKETRIMMDMPITIEVVDDLATQKDIDDVFIYFTYIDETFSTFKQTSEITKINKGVITSENYSTDMKIIFDLAHKTKKETNGYFDIKRNGSYDTSGIVKGWAILQASKILKKKGFKNYFIDAGGDIQTSGHNTLDKKWTVGIRNPFNRNEHIKIVELASEGIATSGTSIRGQHIYNPLNSKKKLEDIVSITVIAKDVCEADRMATGAFAMGKKGLEFIEEMNGLEGYAVDNKGIATLTHGFNKFVKK